MHYFWHIIIVLEIAEKKPQPFVLLIALPVVQVLSLPNTSQHGSPSAVQNAANRLMQVIQESATYNWTSGGESEVSRSFGGYNSVVMHVCEFTPALSLSSEFETATPLQALPSVQFLS